MASSPFHVIVIGGGLGGLCLAQGLHKAGISVAVYERDRTSTDRLQGYRIHIEPQGNRALAACLPADLFKRYLATSGSGGNGFRISTDQLKQLCFFAAPRQPATVDPATLDLSVSRITLREILLSELEEIVHFNKRFTHYQETSDSKVAVYFDDGTSATGDLLVAADGSSSRVRNQFLPHAHPVATGVMAIMGKLALTEEVRQLLVAGQLDGATSVLGRNGQAMFIALHDRGNRPEVANGAVGGHNYALGQGRAGLLDDDWSDYLFWAFIARQAKLPAPDALQKIEGPALQQGVLERIQTWHPRLQQLVRASVDATIICKPLQTSRPIKHWTTTRITLLGDAIHSMPPTRGIGGNTALRDAELLCRQLIAASSGERPLLQAVHDYEVEMLRYGFAAVRGSMQALQLHVADSRLVSTALLRSMNALFALRRLGSRKAA
jgi:salicylate hydroxylase